jgi:energy-coupling factor transporter ATP-binding protein EcfA2
MRLLYWYTRFLDKHGNPRIHHGLRSFELNFSTQTRYHFDADNRILQQDHYNTPLPPKFWSERVLYNINVIVGNNGSGKTTVINVVMEILQELYDRKLESQDETIFLVEHKKGTALIYLTGSVQKPTRIKNTIQRCSKYLFTPGSITSKDEILNRLDRTKLIHITNTFSETDNNRYYKTDNQPHVRANYIYDCSLIGTIRHNASDDCYHNYHEKDKDDPIPYYFVNEHYKQVKFVCDSIQHDYLVQLENKGLPVPVPDNLLITIRNCRNSYNRIIDLPRSIQRQKTVPEKIAYLLCASCFYTFLDNIRKYNVKPPSHIVAPKSATLKDFTYLFDSVQFDQIQLKEVKAINVLIDRCLKYVSFICSNKKQLEHFNITQADLDSLGQGLPTTLELTINDRTIDWLVEFMDHYRRTCVPYYYLDFSWGLSSGEENLLRLFASLFYAFDYSNSNLYNWFGGERRSQCDSVILIMDEADLTFHPEWQRQLIKILTAFLPLEFGQCGINDLQVILTTHSPLLLGDIPSNNVIYLGNNENKSNGVRNTFGQNIHTILKDSFFLANGTLGAFAADKINNTADKLRHFGKMPPQEIEECKTIIDLVAPGILKSKLTELYEKAVNKNAVPLEEAIKESAKKLSVDELTSIMSIIQAEIKRQQK